jgi:hypothetical protein
MLYVDAATKRSIGKKSMGRPHASNAEKKYSIFI